MNHSPTIDLDGFLAKFNCAPELRLYLGVEVEYLLTRNAQPVAVAAHVLDMLADESFTYELSACQIEHRIQPVPTPQLAAEACAIGREKLRALLHSVGMVHRAVAVAPVRMPLDIYPDERYAHIAHSLGVNKLRAACRIMGTHVHVGVGSAAEALTVYNAVVEALPYLLQMCGRRNNERLRLYEIVQPQCWPPLYAHIQAWHARAQQDGFHKNPRNCWHLVRISRHGTVEVRVFPATADSRKIKQWTAAVQSIARSAICS